ncbi:hypothetical protein ACK0BW_11490 [Acinetobacter baumannii]|uniref:Uncharacterized protein n=1 Tax=Acinetobacter seifertii TaxID=1530123 RepID=A0A7H2V6S8_9GAMM|nr:MULTISPECIES: hypothetical protein [Acinetobacter calcoaceticus/baumannii complex]EHU1390042.1 hypothetical protein [Acinetobacter baumannii]MCT9380853.1 hypothetical protein [Acinetobacter baumannii]MDC5238990.1 hypothetical protein [Acinetobacter baumannii]QNX72061.1 hypothetical protein IC776_16860 [Acinetobacter seifertii]TPU95547.1 hypothetical protein FJV26_12820 [Acinetobacter baumannii]
MADYKEQLEQQDTNKFIEKFIADFDSKILRYPENGEKNDYLSFEESIKLLDTPPYKFNDLIISGSLKPCFPWSGFLEVKRKISVYEYRKLFYSDSSGDDFANNFIEEPDVLVRAYVNFNGYVRPVESAHYLNAILVGESKKIAIEDVYLIENLTLDSMVHLMGNHGEPPKKVLGKKELFCRDQAYKIYEAENNNYIDIKSYVFLKDDIQQLIGKNQNIEVDDINEKIKADLLALRKRRNGQVEDITTTTRIYTEVPKLIIELGYQLNALPQVKQINGRNGRDGLRVQVKYHMERNHKALHKDLMRNESTFNQVWTDLMGDIKKIIINKYK